MTDKFVDIKLLKNVLTVKIEYIKQLQSDSNHVIGDNNNVVIWLYKILKDFPKYVTDRINSDTKYTDIIGHLYLMKETTDEEIEYIKNHVIEQCLEYNYNYHKIDPKERKWFDYMETIYIREEPKY